MNHYFRRRHVYLESHADFLSVSNSNVQQHYGLKGSAQDIWELLEYATSVEELSSKLAVKYSSDSDELSADVTGFILQAKERGLVSEAHMPNHRDRIRENYIATLKRSLVNWYYLEHEQRLALAVRGELPEDALERRRLARDIRTRRPDEFNALKSSRRDGRFVPEIGHLFPHTMIGLHRLDNLEFLAETIFAEDIPGDFFEAGVAMGGAAVFMRGLQVAHGQEGRNTWAADSFCGFPETESQQDREFEGYFPTGESSISYSEEEVRDLFHRYELLSPQVHLVPGWFKDSLAGCEVQQISILRVDADLYASTRQVLDALYDRVPSGGFVVIDDYQTYACCKQAVDDFRNEHGIGAQLMKIDRDAVYWRVP